MRPSFRLGLMAVIAVSVTFLAAVPAMAGTGGPVRGDEYIDGVVYGPSAISQSPVLPLVFSGLVRTHARFALPASNHPGAIIRTPKGDFSARLTGAMSTSPKVYSDCYGAPTAAVTCTCSSRPSCPGTSPAGIRASATRTPARSARRAPKPA
jgi:hypothetical protein